MTDTSKPDEPAGQKKKVSLAEAVRNKLAQKKQEQAEAKNNPAGRSGNMTTKSQMTKKMNNQRRRTGGS